LETARRCSEEGCAAFADEQKNASIAAITVRPFFKPINLLTIKARFGQRNGLRRDEISGRKI
jgi:hypothetical protein